MSCIAIVPKQSLFCLSKNKNKNKVLFGNCFLK